MSDSKHTPTPWKISTSGGLILPDNGNPISVICRGFGHDEEDFPNWSANARHIVACVNAFGDTETEIVEKMNFHHLREALKNILAFDLESDGATAEWVELIAAVRDARALIAETEQTA